MIEIERKTTLQEMDNGNSCGLYLMRVMSNRVLSPLEAKNAVISHIEADIEKKWENQVSSKKVNLLADLDIFKKANIIYSKLDKFTGNYGIIFYNQIVLSIPEEIMELRKNISGHLTNLGYSLTQGLYNRFGENWTQPLAEMNGVAYTLSDIKPERRVTGLMVVNTQNDDLLQFIREEYYPKNHIAVSCEMNTEKVYNRNSIIKMSIKIWDNLSQAMGNKTINTTVIDQYDGLLGRLGFSQFRNDRHGGIRMNVVYKERPKILWYKKMTVFYDGEKALSIVLPYLEKWDRAGIRQVNVLQFCHNKDFFYQDSIGKVFANNKLVLLFINKNKIDLGRSEIVPNHGRGVLGRIIYSPSKNQKKNWLEIFIEVRNHLNSPIIGNLVVPVDDKDLHIKTLKLIDEMMDLVHFEFHTEEWEEKIQLLSRTYKEYVLGLEQVQPDTLSEWFKYCTKASKVNDNNIIQAYEKMKKSLEKEYKELSTYLTHYDFSKCMPIPHIKSDNKLIENYYKSLHIEPKTIIIKSINNKSINSIQEIQPTVTFMFVGKDKRILKGSYTINKFYNSKTNEIELLYDRLKGEVTRDQVKNRR